MFGKRSAKTGAKGRSRNDSENGADSDEGETHTVPMSMPSGFWPPSREAELAELRRLKQRQYRPKDSAQRTSSGRSRQTTKTSSLNPNILEADVELESDSDLREIKLGSENVDKTISSIEATLRPHLRNRTRKIIQSRRITSPIDRRSDIVWQDQPARVIKYRASSLHTFGWVPFLVWRNVKATILGNPSLYLHIFCLAGWMVIVHTTGLGASKEDIRAFTSIFSTSYVGAIFNFGTLVTFIQGLFVTLVINRWWSMRTVYAQLSSNTTDLVTMVISVIRNPDDPDNRGGRRAQTELIRYLNLGHVLVLTQADGQSRHFNQKTIWNSFKSLFITSDSSSAQAVSLDGEAEDEASQGEVETTWQKAARDIDFNDLSDEGLVNQDEWDLILQSEIEGGNGRYMLAYKWAQDLLHKLQAEGWVLNSAQTLPTMLNKMTTIVEAAAQIFTYINSQLPYPYVHLVSFVVHSYLWVLATYLGALLHGGLQAGPGFISVTLDESLINSVNAGNTTLDSLLPLLNAIAKAPSQPNGLSVQSVLISPPQSLGDKTFTQVFVYYFLLVAVIAFQGLLDMHTLLDNPFGRHCAKFPLRAQITELMNNCRAILKIGMDQKEPECYEDIFGARCSSPGPVIARTGSADALVSGAMRGSGRTQHLSAGLQERTMSANFLAPKGFPATPAPSRGVRFAKTLSPISGSARRAPRHSRSQSAHMKGSEFFQQHVKQMFTSNRGILLQPQQSSKEKTDMARRAASVDIRGRDPIDGAGISASETSQMSLNSCPSTTNTPSTPSRLGLKIPPHLSTRSEPSSPVCGEKSVAEGDESVNSVLEMDFGASGTEGSSLSGRDALEPSAAPRASFSAPLHHDSPFASMANNVPDDLEQLRVTSIQEEEGEGTSPGSRATPDGERRS